METTFFKNTFKLKPGHFFTYKNGKLDIKSFHKLSYEKEENIARSPLCFRL